MGYTFKKASYPKGKCTNVKKAAPNSDVVRKLRAFLDAEEPRLAYILMNLHRAQGNAITYKELREAILSGEISADYLEQWRQDYSRFVTEHLFPEWMKAIETAAEETARKYPAWQFNPMAEGIREWTEMRSAEFVTSVTQSQVLGLRAVIQRAAILQDLNVDMLARAIRPMVGLYDAQSVANLRYFENLIASGVKEKKALDLAARYGARQHRYRGYLIARCELAYSYNKGAYEAVKQAQAAGYMGEVVKVWSTAADERTCPYCGSLEGKVITMNEEFDFSTKLAATNPGIRLTPPAHPSCRCGVEYREISPPIIR